MTTLGDMIRADAFELVERKKIEVRRSGRAYDWWTDGEKDLLLSEGPLQFALIDGAECEVETVWDLRTSSIRELADERWLPSWALHRMTLVAARGAELEESVAEELEAAPSVRRSEIAELMRSGAGALEIAFAARIERAASVGRRAVMEERAGEDELVTREGRRRLERVRATAGLLQPTPRQGVMVRHQIYESLGMGADLVAACRGKPLDFRGV